MKAEILFGSSFYNQNLEYAKYIRQHQKYLLKKDMIG